MYGFGGFRWGHSKRRESIDEERRKIMESRDDEMTRIESMLREFMKEREELREKEEQEKELKEIERIKKQKEANEGLALNILLKANGNEEAMNQACDLIKELGLVEDYR